jgi:FdhD protein
VCPRTQRGIEPLFAVYAQACRAPLAELVARGLRRIELLAELVPTTFVAEADLRRFDPELRSFVNLNTPADLAALGPQGAGDQPSRWRARALRDDVFVDEEIPVVTEIPLGIHLDGAHVVTLLTDGSHPRELALGYLHNAGLIEDAGQLRHVRLERTRGEVLIRTQANADDADARAVAGARDGDRTADHEAAAAASTGCATGTSFPVQLALLRSGRWTVAGEVHLPLTLLCRYAAQLAARSDTYTATRGVHAAALVDNGGVVCFREDIGRHNALDKLAGWLLLQGRRTAGLAVFLTGRITGEVILKVARVGSPLVFSLARPTLLGLRLAEQHGITVVGSVSAQTGLVFTHGHRVASS